MSDDVGVSMKGILPSAAGSRQSIPFRARPTPSDARTGLQTDHRPPYTPSSESTSDTRSEVTRNFDGHENPWHLHGQGADGSPVREEEAAVRITSEDEAEEAAQEEPEKTGEGEYQRLREKTADYQSNYVGVIWDSWHNSWRFDGTLQRTARERGVRQTYNARTYGGVHAALMKAEEVAASLGAKRRDQGTNVNSGVWTFVSENLSASGSASDAGSKARRNLFSVGQSRKRSAAKYQSNYTGVVWHKPKERWLLQGPVAEAASACGERVTYSVLAYGDVDKALKAAEEVAAHFGAKRRDQGAKINVEGVLSPAADSRQSIPTQAPSTPSNASTGVLSR